MRNIFKSEKGGIDFSTPFVAAMLMLSLYLGIQLFIPFANLLDNASDNFAANGAIFMTIVWIIPLIMVALVLTWLFNKMKEPNY